MPKAKTKKDEPKIVQETRDKILNTFNELVFVEEGHKYFLHGVEYECVSNVTHHFKRPENIFQVIPQSIRYAQKHGETPEFWQAKWQYINDYANYIGTLTHEYGESKFYERIGELDKICPSAKHKFLNGKLTATNMKEMAVDKFYEELPDYIYPVLSETKVYTDNPSLKSNYAGTFDILFYYYDENNIDNSGLVIYDFKTNKDLLNQFGNQILAEPFEYLADQNLSFYYLQLNAYQIPLEDIGLKVVARRIIYLKDDGTYEIFKVPNLTKELRKALSK